MTNKIVVSITTIPKRTSFLYNVINSLLKQTVVPNKIILYYANDSLDGIPENVLNLRDDIFNIVCIHNTYRSYSKFYYSFIHYPDCINILADDDLSYKSHFIENLLNGYKKYQDCMICNVYHTVVIRDNSIYTPTEMPKCNEQYGKYIRPLSGWGTLIPPNFITYNDLVDIDDFVKNIPTHDELYLFYINLKKNKNTYCIGKYNSWLDILNKQKKFDCRLCSINNLYKNIEFGKYIYKNVKNI